MSEPDGPAGRDEPARGADDHAELLSELNAHDLAFEAEVAATDDREAFAFDPDGDPDGTFPQSVASGGPTPEGVILWTRLAPDVFDTETPLAVEVATDEVFEDRVYNGVIADDERIRAHDYTVKSTSTAGSRPTAPTTTGSSTGASPRGLGAAGHSRDPTTPSSRSG